MAMSPRFLLILALLVCLSQNIYAAWTATDNFDCTSPGELLENHACGSGWSGSWVLTGSTITYETAPAGGQPSNEEAARQSATTDNGWHRRTLTTGISSGVVFVRMRASITTVTSFAFQLRNVTGNIEPMGVKFASGNIQMRSSGAWSNVQAFSADTWYTIEMEFDDSTQNDKYRLRIDGGTPTAWTATDVAYTTIDQVQIYAEDTEVHQFWWDDIKAGTAFPTSGNPISYYIRMMQQ
jgi:hypothetical protein